MSDIDHHDDHHEARAGARHVRLRTLILIRWVAVSGQLVSILLVHFWLAYSLPLGLLLGAVALSAAINIAATFARPADDRLSDGKGALFLAYDVAQLTFLIGFTGGLENPFAILFLVPATISATILSLRSTMALDALVIVCVTIVAFLHRPLPWLEEALTLPPLYLLGLWIALVLGTLFVTAYAWRVTSEARRMANALSATQMALLHEQRLSALGSLAAAAAHQLGTPLATIAVVSRELEQDLHDDSPHQEDAKLLVSEVARCREILGRLSALGEGETDEPYGRLPVSGLAEAAAAPHRRDGISLEVFALPSAGSSAAEPSAPRRAEILHGLGNVIENAVQFCTKHVEVVVTWDDQLITIEVMDDGPGVAPSVLMRLGEPYVSSRRKSGRMGLGVFIAKTLLERTGASMSFFNGRQYGARIVITWPRQELEALSSDQRDVKLNS
ncbi:MAG: ActS/PrrB/RegB family redox-sensitive histidine kinase [Alphaproteobacteria bacterium]|nr:ActS/PrrB/RegB family redox-sensitive histidine kinase [Alphaproteobacteria bacterium]